MTTNRRIEDENSRMFMELFYRFGGDQTPARALQQASEAARQQGIDTWQAVQFWTNDVWPSKSLQTPSAK